MRRFTQILTSTDEETRQSLYSFVLKHLHDDAVYLPISYETNKALFPLGSRRRGLSFESVRSAFCRHEMEEIADAR